MGHHRVGTDGERRSWANKIHLVYISCTIIAVRQLLYCVIVCVQMYVCVHLSVQINLFLEEVVVSVVTCKPLSLVVFDSSYVHKSLSLTHSFLPVSPSLSLSHLSSLPLSLSLFPPFLPLSPSLSPFLPSLQTVYHSG